MKRTFIGLGIVVCPIILYLIFWPVSVAPVSWDAPKDQGYTGAFTPNSDLQDLELLSIGDAFGPEDAVYIEGNDGILIYVPGHTGEIIEINPRDNTHKIIAYTGGVPLGMEFGTDGILYVADAYKGLLSVTRGGSVTLLTDSVDGTPILYADDLDIGPDGVIYFSDASTRFGAEASAGTLSGSLLEIMEHGRTGRILAYDPATQATSVITDGLSFSNGVAMSADGESVLVNETGEYRVLRIWVKGAKTGQSEVVIDNLPGFPDNINRGPDGTFLLGLVSQRSAFLDQNSAKPFIRKLALRLPEFMRPQARSYGFIVQIDASGNVLRTWQDPTGAYPMATGAIIAPDGYMYVSSLTAKNLARKKVGISQPNPLTE